MKSIILASAMLIPLSGFAMAEKNECNNPNLTENHQGECVPRFGASGETFTFRQPDRAPIVNDNLSDSDFGGSSYPTSPAGNDAISQGGIGR